MMKLSRSLGPLLGSTLFIAALLILYHELRHYHYHEIVQSLRTIPDFHLVAALALTVVNYILMTGYDSLAFRYINHPLGYKKIALASFVGYAFSNNMGLSMIAGSSVRYRLYSAWGLSAHEITKVVFFYTLTLWLGLFTIGSAVFLLKPLSIPLLLHIPFDTVFPLGIILLILLLGYLLMITMRKKGITIRGWEFPIPSLNLSFFQIILSSLDWMLAGSVLYVLISQNGGISFPTFLGIYLLGQIAGLVSQVPGGLGVFETVLLVILSQKQPAPSLVAALLAYRIIYYLIPLGIAAILLGTHEALDKREALKKVVHTFGSWGAELAPRILSLTTFLGGIILLFTGALPSATHRLMWLKSFIPLPLMEISHFFGSLVGLGLLLLSRGLQRRLDAAYILTIVLLSLGIVLSLFKGLDYEEAFILAAMVSVFVPCRRFFYRKASLIEQRFTTGWTAAIVLALISSLWLGFFFHKHVEYTHELWWSFSLHGDAPRFLRAEVGTFIAALGLAIAYLLRPASLEPMLPDSFVLEKTRAIVSLSKQTSAHLALLGDKALLFSQSGKGFIMYGVEDRSWIAMGDPVGSEEERVELVWRFRELCDRHGGWTVFYEVGRENLPLYLELGLSLIKLGEEARVPLTKFSLEGSTHKGLRYTYNKLEREGLIFEVIPSENTPFLLPDLKKISDAWLANKNTREKRFSLGFFKPEYLKNYPVGIVRKESKIIAFANIWSGAEKEELSLDLMRYLPESPHSIMEYLFTKLMLWGKEQGYVWFNLGMAPLSGLEDHHLAPLWNKLGTFIFRYGEHFYNFQGIRDYKEKFAPLWESKYMASPGGLVLPRIFVNIASLISGGMKGIVTK